MLAEKKADRIFFTRVHLQNSLSLFGLFGGFVGVFFSFTSKETSSGYILKLGNMFQ